MGVLTKFSKGIKKSRALSFSRSARDNCDDTCRQKSGACYALGPEARYRDYGKKLIRHAKTKPYNLLKLAQYEVSQIKEENLKWFRFSVSGSFPRRSQLSYQDWIKFTLSMREFCKDLVKRNVKVHLPVESINKARSLRSILHGLPIIIRRTIQDKRNLLDFQDHCAYVVGDNIKEDNMAKAFSLAKLVRKRGKSVVVCPAITNNSKCGRCTACAEDVDLILYPLHK